VLKKTLNATNLWALAKQWAERRVKNLENGRLDGETNLYKDLNHMSNEKKPGCLRYMDVTENSGTPKSSNLIGFSIINHPFWDTPIFGNTHIGDYTSQSYRDYNKP